MLKNFGIIGVAGYIAPRHLKAIKDTGNNLSVAFDVNDSVGVIDSFFPEAKFFTEFELFSEYASQLTQNSTNKLDFISICSPNYLHLAHISAALRIGCDVICEKPLVPDLNSIMQLEKLEKSTGRNVFSILQLRHHHAIKTLRSKILKNKTIDKANVDLTYITSRGDWYLNSWKNDPKKGFGIVTNIGIHFFDMLSFVFGDLENCEVEVNNEKKARGTLVFEKARVSWFLSIDAKDLPIGLDEKQRTYRSIKIDGTELEFSDGFTELHTESYKQALIGKGFGLGEAKKAIKIVEAIRNMS